MISGFTGDEELYEKTTLAKYSFLGVSNFCSSPNGEIRRIFA